jgi:hypothetical protein
MRRSVFVLMGMLLVLLVTASGSVAQEAVGTGFTYQGFLKEGGSPADGAYDLEFRLYDAESGGD